MSKPRFVLDTNLIVQAALLDTSPARRAFEVALLQGEILLSDAVQAELSEGCAYLLPLEEIASCGCNRQIG